MTLTWGIHKCARCNEFLIKFHVIIEGSPLNSLVNLSGARAPKVNFYVNVTVIDDLHSSVQSVPLKHVGPLNVVSWNSSDTAQLSYTPSFIASLPLGLPHTGGHLKYSATFDADGGDDIDGIAICVSWYGSDDVWDSLNTLVTNLGSMLLLHISPGNALQD